MSATLELMPTAKLEANSGTNYLQPTDTVVDVSGYTEAAVMVVVQAIDRNSGTTSVKVQTAIENREELYVDHTTVATYTADPSLPDAIFMYFAGSTTGSSVAPGFGKYLRIKVEFNVASASITLGAKAVLKP